MAKKKKYARSPLLYIHQPDISNPKAPMQSNYSTPRNKKQEEPVAQKPQAKNVRPLNRDIFTKKSGKQKTDKKSGKPPERAELKEEAEEQEQAKPQSSKKFTEMTIPEKIDYFISKPKNMPIMKCEVKTEERNYRGIILSVEDEEDQILMRVGRRTSTTKIAIESITDIRLIGF
ncbi:hypothetical protein CFK37_00475 [Virgibacillus phasianinus]|uniref:Spore coat protein CotO n=1 Tax=Virgibacillus phasianinus TaxID=2017483 RepID=A0A220TYB1_9BACI|nr:CotO family spore coat protein [Virgibacillus phasianinus]ASK60787.1 hypothetical protein CFK37_00475 [Virgibacillus phasianinus]